LGKLFSHDDYLVNKLIGLNPDIIAFSSVTDWFSWNIDFAKKIKKKLSKVPIIFGGIHATSSPDFLLKYEEIDYVCVGEGEFAFCEFVDAMEKNQDVSNIPNISGKGFKNPPRKLIENLDSLPFPDKSLFYESEPYFSNVYTIMASR
jgi:anaerobic magnesium-protoporphyrin IX monomethyl ester cyclase